MEIAQLTTTRVAPIDFTANTVAELRILNLRDSDEDLSQAQNVIRQCSMQNRLGRLNRPFFTITPETRRLWQVC